MAPSEWIDTVENLIETCKDGEDGYREAARNVVRPELKRYFEDQSGNREQFADGLRRELSQVGEMDVQGSIAAAIHRSWLDLLASFGGGEKGVLTAVREGERRAIAAYERAVATPLPPQIERLARNQLDNILEVYKHLEGLERSAA